MGKCKWTVLEPDSDGYIDVIDGAGMCVAACLPPDLAHLIAAAPELYEALDRLLSRIAVDADAKGWFIDEQKAAFEALAKAKGELQ